MSVTKIILAEPAEEIFEVLRIEDRPPGCSVEITKDNNAIYVLAKSRNLIVVFAIFSETILQKTFDRKRHSLETITAANLFNTNKSPVISKDRQDWTAESGEMGLPLRMPLSRPAFAARSLQHAANTIRRIMGEVNFG